MGWSSGKRKRFIPALVAAAMLTTPALAQFSDSYNFLKAVRDRDGAKVTEAVDRPGASIINTRDYSTGESALHIIVKRRDNTWLAFLLAKGAKPDMKDNGGNTPLNLAAQLRFIEGAQLLISAGAAPNIPNSRGETPLIMAVHNRDAAMVRALLAGGANPLLPDRIAGKSARDYAAEDSRSPAILKLIDEAKPAKPKGKIAGPGL